MVTLYKKMLNVNKMTKFPSSQVVELEQRLRETFPVMVATSAAAAAPSTTVAAAAARLSLPPSLAAVGSNREPAAAVMQGKTLICCLRSDNEALGLKRR